MDGYAVVASDGPGVYPVATASTAGEHSELTLTPGNIAYIKSIPSCSKIECPFCVPLASLAPPSPLAGPPCRHPPGVWLLCSERNIGC